MLTVGDPIYQQPSRPAEPKASWTICGPALCTCAVGVRSTHCRSPAGSRNGSKSITRRLGWGSGSLRDQAATEGNLRAQIAGRRLIHLASHGLADQQHGNFFGALALTPKLSGTYDPANDGFLTLPEIYELNLSGCELTILSACQTNYGPQQRGEGIWALSRAFLVAGSRRVVATNWNVTDRSAATLVSYFTRNLAQAEARKETPNYARALHEAKRRIRSEDKDRWASPFYWAPFVLIGRNRSRPGQQ